MKDIKYIVEQPIEDYHANRTHLSRSALSKFLISPYHYWAYYLSDNPPPKKKLSEAFIMGNRVHQYLLENDKYFKENTILERLKWTTVAGRAQKKEWEELESKGLILIPKNEHDEIVEMAEGCLTLFPRIKELIQGGLNEQSIYWTDELTEVNLKCRPDIMHSHIICDIKTTNDASFKAFSYTVKKRLYHLQAAMMMEGAHALGYNIQEFYFICIETDAPYACALYKASEQTLSEGRMLLHDTLCYFKKCQAKNEWPTYDILEI